MSEGTQLRSAGADRVATWGASVLGALEQARARRFDVAASCVAALWDTREGNICASVGVRFHEQHDRRPHALLLGRHPLCELSPVPHAAQRHALLLMWPPGEARVPRVELVDFLAGFQVGAGGAAQLAVGAGACRFSISVADLVVLQAPAGRPLFEGDPAQAAAALSVQQPRPPASVEADDFDAAESTRPDRLALAQPGSMLGFVDESGAIRDAIGLPLFSHGPLARVELSDRALDRPVILGRHPAAVTHRVFENIQSVSRIHACLLARRDGLWIVDCGSRNGTEVLCRRTGQRVALGHRSRAHRLGPDDRIFLGEYAVHLAPGPRALACLHGRDDFVAPLTDVDLG